MAAILLFLNQIANPILVLCALYGLNQIWIARKAAEHTKRTIQIKLERESRRVAVEQALVWANEITDLANKFYNLYIQGTYPALKQAVDSTTTKDHQQYQVNIENMQNLLNEAKEQDNLVYGLANKIEGFAMYFTNGIADVEVIRKPIKVSFCNTIQLLLPFLLYHHDVTKGGCYHSTLALYASFRNADVIIATKKEIEEKQQYIAKTQVPQFKPYGLDELRK